MSYKSKDTLLMQELWRKAYREGVVEIRFPTENNAHRSRMLLYNAVKREKAGQVGEGAASLELAHAAESVEIVFGKTRNVLRLQRKSDNPIFKAMGEALGQMLDEVGDADAAESLARIVEEVNNMPTGTRPREEVIPMPTIAPVQAPAQELRPEETPFIPPMPGKKNPFY